VTGLGEFALIGWHFTYIGHFFDYYKSSPHFWTTVKVMIYFFTKNSLGYSLGDFFPELIRSHCWSKATRKENRSAAITAKLFQALTARLTLWAMHEIVLRTASLLSLYSSQKIVVKKTFSSRKKLKVLEKSFSSRKSFFFSKKLLALEKICTPRVE
jgi:hypothetical protein